MKPHSRVPLLLGVLALLAVLPLEHNLRRTAEALRPRHDLRERILYLPSGEYLAPACLGFDGVVADVLWIRAVLYFGENHGRWDFDDWYLWLYYMVDLVTDLDPHFITPYKYGGVMLRISPEWTAASDLIMAKGMENNPDEWYFPFSIAMNYFFRDDVQRAARYMELAAADPGAPFYLPNLAASLLNDTDQEEVALQFLLEEYETAPDEKRRGAVFVKIQETRFEIAERDLQRARERYRWRHGREAVGLDDLVPDYVPAVPDDPYAVFVDDPAGCGLIIDPLDRGITSRCLRPALENIRANYDVGSLR